jgi:four helix bundle protein
MTEYNLRQRSYAFSVGLVRFLNKLSATKISAPILNQLVRSGTSVGANIEEADSAPSRKDFRNKMFIAKKEAAETTYWLKLIVDAEVVNNPANKEKAKELLDECSQILKIIGSITRKIK